jgi:hypothetical protein
MSFDSIFLLERLKFRNPFGIMSRNTIKLLRVAVNSAPETTLQILSESSFKVQEAVDS